MRALLILSAVLLVVQLAYAPPVTKNKKDETDKEHDGKDATAESGEIVSEGINRQDKNFSNVCSND